VSEFLTAVFSFLPYVGYVTIAMASRLLCTQAEIHLVFTE
jgi:hypothetical protein